jgi:hypothetical protein
MNATDAEPPGDNGSPFFIVGAGRSGTTLLRLILAGHSRLHVCPETWFIADLVARLPLRRPLAEHEVADAIEIITSHYRWPDLGLAPQDLRAALEPAVLPTLRTVVDAVYSCLARQAGKPRLGDKTPTYVRILPALAALYPEAQFIHVLRDGRDVAISYIDAGWPQRCYEGSQFEWIAAVRAARRFARTAPAGTWCEVRYEDLATESEAAIRRICAFLGEKFEPAMMNFSDRTVLVPDR